MKKNFQFKNKFVLVTGASGGIGFQIAKDFLSQGAFVGAHYCHNNRRARELLKYGGRGRCRVFQADFLDTAQVNRLYKEFIQWSHGSIDVLVNNVGEVGRPMGFEELTEEAWDHAFQVNVKAPFFLSRAALKDMAKSKRGRIINISSIGVKFGGGPKTLHYSASKAALEAVTRSLAKVAAPYNVLINTVRAGVTETAIYQKTARTDFGARVALIPLKRPAKPAEISNVVLFIAGDQSSFMTNTIIDVAGGE